MKEYVGKTLMLLENDFPGDVRVNNEAHTLADAGYKVTVLAIRSPDVDINVEHPNIKVYRIPCIEFFRKTCSEDASYFKKLLFKTTSNLGYIMEYFYFTSACFLCSLYILYKEGFDIIHAHNPPDTLFLVGGFYKLFGKKFIFDHHDVSPELYISRFKANNNFLYYCLLFLEKLSLKFADVVIATNESYKNIEISRAKINPDKIYIVRNGPNNNRIYPVPIDTQLKSNNRIILAYLGVIGPQDGLDYLVKSLHYLTNTLKRDDYYCVIIGSGDSLENTIYLSNKLGLHEHVLFTGYVPHGTMLKYLSTADICLDPNPSNPLNDVSTWIKVMEYMALGKPIVSFDLVETRYTAKEAALYVKPNDIGEFARSIETLMDDESLRTKMGNFGVSRINQYLSWDIVSKNLLSAYNSII